MDEKYLKVNEVAKILHVRIETVRRYIQQRAIIALILPGGDYRIAESELNKLLNRITAGRRRDTES
jgi:excisionase family DNA binding protein